MPRRMFVNPAVFNIPRILPTDAIVELQRLDRVSRQWEPDGVASGTRCQIEESIENLIRRDRLAGHWDTGPETYRAKLA